MHVTAYIVLALLIAVVILGVIAIASPRHRRRMGEIAAWSVGGLVAAYLVGRGIAEFFLVNYSHPASYRDSWGGPSLAGVFAVHSGPGFLVLVAGTVFAWRKVRARRPVTPARDQRQVTSLR